MKYMRLITLGYVAGTIYCLMYIRYVFYDQMIELMGCTNAQLGLLNTVSQTISLALFLVGPYLADKLEAKKVITFAIGGITVLTFIFAVFVSNYNFALVIWGLQPIIMMPYWACLVKYINNLGGEGESGNSFGTYYLINGLSGALGNAIPLAVSRHFGFQGAVVTLGVMTLIGTIMAVLFLENEKQLAEKGVYLKGDEPIRVKYILDAIKWPGFWILGFAYLATYTIYSNVSYFNPYLVNVMGVPAEISSTLSVIRTYFLMLVCPIGGVIADKIFKSTAKAFVLMFSVSAVLFAVVFFFKPGMNMWVAAVYSLVPSLVVMPLYSISNSVIRELHVPNSILGTTIAISGITGTLVDMVPPAIYDIGSTSTETMDII